MTTTNLGLDTVPTNTTNPSVPVNDALAIMDAILAGTATRNLSADANYTLVLADYLTSMLLITDTSPVLTGPRDVIFPAQFPTILVRNATAQTLTLKKTGQPGIAIAPGESRRVSAGPADVESQDVDLVAADVPISDAGGYFTGGNVEAALQQLGALGGGGSGGSGFFMCETFGRGIVTSTGGTFLANEWRPVAYLSGTGADAALNAPGVLMNTGTASNGLVDMFVTAGALIKPGRETQRFGCRLEIPVLSDGTQSFVINFGLLHTTNLSDTERVVARYTHSTNSGQWTLRTMAGGVQTEVNSSVAVVGATEVELELEVNAAVTEVNLYVNGILAATSTTNIPTAALGLAAAILKSAGTTARTARIVRMWRR